MGESKFTIPDCIVRLAETEEVSRNAIVLSISMVLAGIACLFDAGRFYLDEPDIRAVMLTIVGLVILASSVGIFRTKAIDLFLSISALSGYSLFFGFFFLSGDIYYIAAAIAIPVFVAMFASSFVSLSFLVGFVALTASLTLAYEAELWVPVYTDSPLRLGLAKESLSNCVFAVALTCAALWKAWLNRLANQSQAEVSAQLMEQHRRFNAIRETTSAAIFDADECGMITRIAGELEGKLGYEKDGVVGRLQLSLLDREDARKLLRETLILEDGNYSYTAEARLICNNGSLRWVRIQGGTYRDHEGKRCWVSMVQDIEREVANRAHMFEQSRLDSLEDVCGGLAHDFNNLLTVIGVYCELLQDSNERQGILEAQKQASELTANLLAFARKQEFRNTVFDLNEHLNVLRPMIDRMLPATIHSDWRYGDGALHVESDPAQIQQVLINLVTNAMHSMADGGSLTITTSKKRIDQISARRYTIDRGDYVSIRVTDTGQGIRPDVQERIFEPYFTTKLRGHGSGLGLATVLGVCRQAGGTAAVESRVGVGTTLEVLLPLSAEEVSDASALLTSDLQVYAARNGERILVVDDREVLGHALRRTLKTLGYDVTYMPTGEAAFDFLNESVDVDLIIADIVLPGMSGIDLISKLRGRDPATKALLISAYDQEDMVFGSRELEITRFLQKPFRTKELLTATHDLLRGTSPL